MKHLFLRASAQALALAALAPAAYAAPGASSAYVTDAQSSHVEDATSQGIGEVNMIVCIMSALRPDALVNQGDYIALVDKNKCDSEKRSSTSNSGSTSDGAQAAASYVTATVNSSRTSNSDPMVVKTWLELEEEGMKQTIFVHISATQAPTATNPYGVFRLDYCGKVDGVDGCPSAGYLEGMADGLNFYQLDLGDQNQNQSTALRLAAVSGTSGNGRLHRESPWDGNSTFSFAYDPNLFLRSDGNTDQCFSRDASDPDTGLSVWRYGLYDLDTGARVTRNSGFPIEFTASGTTYNGYLGYYGLNLPQEAMSALHNGSTVDKVDYSTSTPTRTSYSVVKADGKLMKFTRKTRTLQSMDKIRFNIFVGMDANSFFAGAQQNVQYELYWDEATKHFIASGVMNCSPSGCQTDQIAAQTIPLSYWQSRGGAQGYSQSLGGEVFIDLHAASDPVDSSTVQVVFRSQDIVYPADMPQTLFCLQNCPTAASMASYFAPGSTDDSPYVAATYNNWMPTTAGSEVVYGTDSASATLQDGANAAVTFTDSEALSQHPQYQNGIMTGRLFEHLADVECAPSSGTYCDWKANDLEVYYQWQTGPNAYNQFAAVKNSSGDYVAFDAPLQLSYHVPNGAAYGDYAGKDLVLQYGGFGDLWGIPGVCVSRVDNSPVNCSVQNSRYVPSFVIPYDQTVGRVTDTDGAHTYLVKWLDREIRFASKPLSTCTSGAGLTTSANVTLPTSADLKDPTNSSSTVYIGAKPTVTSAPRVIHGDVKY